MQQTERFLNIFGNFKILINYEIKLIIWKFRLCMNLKLIYLSFISGIQQPILNEKMDVNPIQGPSTLVSNVSHQHMNPAGVSGN